MGKHHARYVLLVRFPDRDKDHPGRWDAQPVFDDIDTATEAYRVCPYAAKLITLNRAGDEIHSREKQAARHTLREGDQHEADAEPQQRPTQPQEPHI